ncbi:transcriptional regulator [Thiohalobacter thiocyanaticus]|uniref:Transcriptional regulator n=1 Tax=Thiohalobacter thiocyanaticus TaxID=585455 RepID=A0A1Z4VSK6_9GAMM|nr:helix-turn-helix transcriptional regulator [Thiohalobacter thiocyanaticus]BAZ94619.1 transcriptional regulator [Thiohalobacter thiocyanaticus]
MELSEKSEDRDIEGWADRARTMLDRRGLTYDQIASALDVATRSAVGHYLSGRRQLSAMQAVALAQRLGCRVGWLLTGEQPIEPVENASDTNVSPEDLLAPLKALPADTFSAVANLVLSVSSASHYQGAVRKSKQQKKSES